MQENDELQESCCSGTLRVLFCTAASRRHGFHPSPPAWNAHTCMRACKLAGV